MINMGPDSFRAAQPATARSGRGLWRNGAKRAFETLLILLTAPVTLPLMLLMAGLVALDGHNPFFAQKRIGRNGRVFRIWRATVRAPNGMLHERETQPVLHEPRANPIELVELGVRQLL